MSSKPPRRINILSALTDLLIDLAFMAIGFLVYYHFLVSPLFYLQPDAVVTLSPVLTNLVGGFTNAVYIFAGIPFLIGFFGLVRLVMRLFQGMMLAARKA
jgi:hypothetical protein